MKRLALVLLLAAACLGPQDDPSQVRDLRVIGASMEPPELMILPPPEVNCFTLLGGVAAGLGGAGDGGISPAQLGPLLALLAPYAQPVQMTWLIQDPNGAGRPINYDVRACSNVNDLQCDDDGGWVQLEQGTLQPGEHTLSRALGFEFLSGSLSDGGTSLLGATVLNDTYRGLGGIRVPVVMHLSAGTEQVFAQKLMVYSCRVLPEMKPNVNPVIPGLRMNGFAWDAGDVIRVRGATAEWEVTPDDLTGLEETYVVPSLSLKPVTLVESWKISWHSTLGRFSSTTTGGTDFTGATGKHHSMWLPRIDGGTEGIPEQDVDFWAVVRDGRGGETWLNRKAHFVP